MLAPFECLCGNFILPEPASYVFFYAVFNLRNLFYLIRKKGSTPAGNVIKLSKSAHTKKCPPRFFEVGIFYAFVMWFACAYFAGRTMTRPSKMVLAFTRRSALRSKMALYFIKFRNCLSKMEWNEHIK